MATLRAPTGIRLSKEHASRLTELADRNERSLAAEIRLAIREHLNVHDPDFDADALSGSEEHRVSSRLASGQGNAAEDQPPPAWKRKQAIGGE